VGMGWRSITRMTGIRWGSGIPGAKTEGGWGIPNVGVWGERDFLPALKGSGVRSSAVVNRQSDLSEAVLKSH
jgi:hypothetical protein